MSQCTPATWSYSYDPLSTPKDYVRFLLGDTNEDDKIFFDPEINALLSFSNQDPLSAAIRGCEQVIAKFSRSVDESVGSVSISFSQRLANYKALKATLMQRQAMEDIRPYCGGISIMDKQQHLEDSDRVRPEFTKDMLESDNPTLPYTPGSYPRRFGP